MASKPSPASAGTRHRPPAAAPERRTPGPEPGLRAPAAGRRQQGTHSSFSAPRAPSARPDSRGLSDLNPPRRNPPLGPGPHPGAGAAAPLGAVAPGPVRAHSPRSPGGPDAGRPVGHDGGPLSLWGGPGRGSAHGCAPGCGLSGASAHTGDRSTRWAEWLLLSQGLSLEEAVPGRVPLVCEPQRGGG